MGVLCLVLVMLCSTMCHVSFYNHLTVERRAGCFNLIVYLLSYGCECFVSIPRGAVGWSAVFDWGIY